MPNDQDAGGEDRPLSVPRNHDLVTIVYRDHVALVEAFRDALAAAREEGGSVATGSGGSVGEPDATLRWWQAAHELARHEAAEDAALYAALESCGRAHQAVASEGRARQRDVAGQLAALERSGIGRPGFDDGLSLLVEAIDDHVRWEEKELLPIVAGLPDEERFHWGDRYAQAKKFAPSRPHPRLGAGRPPSRAAAALLVVFDRLRDAWGRQPMPNRSGSPRPPQSAAEVTGGERRRP